MGTEIVETDDLVYREIESQLEATLLHAPAEQVEPDAEDAFVAPEVRESVRLSRKPGIDHLPDGAAFSDELGCMVPLFDTGDRIIAERRIGALKGSPWLDTRIYIVKSIDDEKGLVHCQDEEQRHYACVGFKDPFTRIKLVPKRGNPFKAPKDGKPLQMTPVVQGEKKRRGRPKGSLNRAKDVIRQEKLAKREARK